MIQGVIQVTQAACARPVWHLLVVAVALSCYYGAEMHNTALRAACGHLDLAGGRGFSAGPYVLAGPGVVLNTDPWRGRRIRSPSGSAAVPQSKRPSGGHSRCEREAPGVWP